MGLPIQDKAESSEAQWNLRKAVYSSAKEMLGYLQRYYQNWFVDNDDRWREYSLGLLNRPSVDNTAIHRLNQRPTCSDLDISPTEAELIVALKLVSSVNAPGADSILLSFSKRVAMHFIVNLFSSKPTGRPAIYHKTRDTTVITISNVKVTAATAVTTGEFHYYLLRPKSSPKSF